jgi:hypothetical protein
MAAMAPETLCCSPAQPSSSSRRCGPESRWCRWTRTPSRAAPRSRRWRWRAARGRRAPPRKRRAPRAVSAEPVRSRACSTSPVPAWLTRMVAERLGVAERRSLLELAGHLADRRVDIDQEPSSPGPAPGAHARSTTLPTIASSWRTCPKVKSRRNVRALKGPSPGVGAPPSWSHSAARRHNRCGSRLPPSRARG